MNGTTVQFESDKIMAQFAFACASGRMPDFTDPDDADSKCAPFEIKVKYRVGVMVVDDSDYAKVPVDEAGMDIYVFYEIDKSLPVPKPLGWTWGNRLETCDISDGQYYFPVSALRPMNLLVKMMEGGLQ